MIQDIDTELIKEIQEICADNYPNEACGVVANGKVINCGNLAENQEDGFIINPEMWSHVSGIDFIWHSHCDDSDLSFTDIQTCKQLKMPMYLFSLPTGGEYYYDCKVMQPLLGRKFVYWAADCWTLIQDWYRIEKSVELTDHPRALKTAEGIFDWDSPNWDIYRQMLPIHFDRHPTDTQLERGDLILSTIRWNSPPGSPETPNHLAICDDPVKNEMLHHLYGRLSERSIYGNEGRRATESIWKFRE